MRSSILSRLLWSLMTAALLSAVITVANPTNADAAQRVRVDFTVRETLPLSTPGPITASNIPGCPTGSVANLANARTDIGPIVIFTGSKLVDCGGGNTFSFSYWAWTQECRRTDRGGWVVTGGTGSFAGARGFGRLVGTFFVNDGSSPSFCNSDGILDRWRGRMWLQ